jgi:hypothetical protein
MDDSESYASKVHEDEQSYESDNVGGGITANSVGFAQGDGISPFSSFICA